MHHVAAIMLQKCVHIPSKTTQFFEAEKHHTLSHTKPRRWNIKAGCKRWHLIWQTNVCWMLGHCQNAGTANHWPNLWSFLRCPSAGPVFSYKLQYIVGFWLVFWPIRNVRYIVTCTRIRPWAVTVETGNPPWHPYYILPMIIVTMT